DGVEGLASAVARVGGNGDICLVAAPAQAVAIRLRLPEAVAWPVLTSASLAAGTVIAVAANAVVSAIQGVPQITASTEMAVHMDTAPGAIIAAGGVVASMFQKDEVALKLSWALSWALRDARAAAWMQSVSW